MPPTLDAVQVHMGAYGKYQFRLTILIYIVKFSIAFNQIGIVFFGPRTSFKCDGVEGKCPCSEPEYDKSVFTKTIVTEWNLICGRKWLISFTQSFFQLGTLLGSIFFGMASDRFGRRRPLLVAVVMQLVAGFAVAFVPTYWSFTFLRFVVGLAVGGTMVTTFVIIMEFVGTQYREIISALYQFPFNLGHMLLPGIAYFIRDYHKLALAITVASIMLLPYFCFVPDTPRWLLAAKRTDDAVKIITRVARVNKLPTESIPSDIQTYMSTMEQHHLKKATVLDLFRTRNIRKRIICMSMNWWACSYCFYGVSQYVGQLYGNLFINVLASACFTGMGTLLSIPLMKLMGRKVILISQNFLSATCLILLALNKNTTISVVLAVIGMMASFIVFVVVYLYTGELFPTVVRNAAVGFCSMMARVGSMIAPFVIDTAVVGKWLPPLLFATFPLIAGFLAFFLPETKGRELMNTIEEAEEFGK